MTDDAMHEAVERAKHVLRVEQSVLTHYVAGLRVAESAEALGLSVATVWYFRRHSQLTRPAGRHRAAQGRSREVTLVVEVRS